MGIRGFYSYIQDFVDAALVWHKLQNCKLVIDGNNLAHEIYSNSPGMCSAFGGDYDKYAMHIEKFFNKLLACKIEPIVVMDGGYPMLRNKFNTVYSRLTDQMENCKTINPDNHDEVKVFPLMARSVFVLTLQKMEVKVLQSDFEADDEIAVIATNMGAYVLSNDSDFYLFDVPFILLNSINMKHVQKEQTKDGATSKFIPCYRFDVGKFCEITNMRRELIPLLAPLLGNDYINPKCMYLFYNSIQHLRPPAKRNISMRKKIIISVIKWLAVQKGKPEEILERVIAEKRNFLSYNVKKGLRKAFQMYFPKTSYLNSWVSDHDESCFVKAGNNSITDGNRDLGFNFNCHFLGSNFLNETLQCTCKSKCDNTILNYVQLPDWFIRSYRTGLIPHIVVDFLTKDYFFPVPQIEIIERKCIYFSIQDLIRTIRSLLWVTYAYGCEKGKLKVDEIPVSKTLNSSENYLSKRDIKRKMKNNNKDNKKIKKSSCLNKKMEITDDNNKENMINKHNENKTINTKYCESKILTNGHEKGKLKIMNETKDSQTIKFKSRKKNKNQNKSVKNNIGNDKKIEKSSIYLKEKIKIIDDKENMTKEKNENKSINTEDCASKTLTNSFEESCIINDNILNYVEIIDKKLESMNISVEDNDKKNGFKDVNVQINYAEDLNLMGIKSTETIKENENLKISKNEEENIVTLNKNNVKPDEVHELKLFIESCSSNNIIEYIKQDSLAMNLKNCIDEAKKQILNSNENDINNINITNNEEISCNESDDNFINATTTVDSKEDRINTLNKKHCINDDFEHGICPNKNDVSFQNNREINLKENNDNCSDVSVSTNFMKEKDFVHLNINCNDSSKNGFSQVTKDAQKLTESESIYSIRKKDPIGILNMNYYDKHENDFRYGIKKDLLPVEVSSESKLLTNGSSESIKKEDVKALIKDVTNAKERIREKILTTLEMNTNVGNDQRINLNENDAKIDFSSNENSNCCSYVSENGDDEEYLEVKSNASDNSYMNDVDDEVVKVNQRPGKIEHIPPLRIFYRGTHSFWVKVLKRERLLNYQSLPSLFEIQDFSESLKLDFFYHLISINRNIQASGGIEFILLCICFWKKKFTQTKANDIFSIIVCVIMFYVIDRKINRVRHKRSPDEAASFQRKIEYLNQAGKFGDASLMTIEELIESLTKEECKLASYYMNNFHNIDKTVNKRNYDRFVVHSFSAFQAAVSFLHCLNSLLYFPFPVIGMDSIWSGTFCYNIHNFLSRVNDINILLDTIFAKNERMKILFFKLYSEIGKLAEVPDVESASNNGSTNVKKVQKLKKRLGLKTVPSKKKKKMADKVNKEVNIEYSAEELVLLAENRFSALVIS